MPASSADIAIATPHADLAACRSLLAGGSRSFRAASRLLPASLGDAACQLYAFCREADDLIDEGASPRDALGVLERRISAVYRGEPGPSSTDRALSEVVQRYGVPRALLDALLEGFAWDADRRRYENLSDVLDYSARVAGSVGVMMALLMGNRDPQVLARAAELGLAMQLTNIARDVGEDARAGRLYLPLQWLRDAGIDPGEFLSNPRHSAQLASVIRRLLDEAHRLYQRADSGIAALPRSCRPGIYAARLLYSGIGDQLARQEYDAVTSRSVVPASRKLALLAQVFGVVQLARDGRSHPPMAETGFLITAVERGSVEFEAGRPAEPDTSPGSFSRRMIWMLELFEAMEARDRAAPRQRAG
jgi:phytoene synthase